MARTLTLEQHAERANAIIWAEADEAAQDGWVEESLEAQAEGHKHSEVARAFGVADSTLRSREKAYRLRRSEDKQGARDRNRRDYVTQARGKLRDPELASEILADPKVRDSVRKALFADPTPTERAANRRALAQAHETTRPLREAVAHMTLGPAIELLQEGLDAVQKAIASDADLTPDEVETLAGIVRDLAIEVEVARTRREVKAI